jgi:arabinogalactan endo-1,4-beta-galactosidase
MAMRVSDAFPSDWLRAADLQKREVLVTIADVKMETVGDDTKPALYFEGKEKGMILNKTNATAIATMYGDDMDDWKGEQVTLFEAMVSFKGDTVPAIRVKPPSRKAVGAKRKQAPAVPDVPETTDDEIPF